MEEFRMQMECMIIIALIMFIYFKGNRQKTREHVVYKTMLWVGLANVVFDIITVYCVNHLHTVPMIVTNIMHRVFYICICCYMFLLYLYIVRLVELDFTRFRFIQVLLWIPITVSLLVPIFLNIRYIESSKGNYSTGPAVYAVFFFTSFYMIVGLIIFIIKFRTISMSKRTILTVALGIEVIVCLLQAMVPTMLITSMGTTIILFAIFATMENPDRLLIELYNYEKTKAEKASESKTQFLAHMSHEIRTPINTILGMDELILREYDDPNLVGYASNIREAGDTLLTLVNDILDLSKIDMGRIELVKTEYSTGSLLNEVYNMNYEKAHQKQLDLIFDIDTKLPSVLQGDDVRVMQVMNNLLTNAIKYTHEGSVICKVSGDPIPKSQKIMFLVQVIDTGIGIKDEDIEKLFIAFERINLENNRKIEGAGLGLSISKKLVTMMGGILSVRSEFGKGSEFSFNIPQTVIDHTEIGDFSNQQKRSQSSRNQYYPLFQAPLAKILVADDNPMNLKVVEYLLKETKVHVEKTCSGAGCIAFAKKNEYHLILLDHMMPEMDGTETLHRLREAGIKIPIIVLTANAVLGAKEQYLAEGFDDYVAKPVESKQLEKTISKHLPQNLVIYNESPDNANDGKSSDFLRKNQMQADDSASSEPNMDAELVSNEWNLPPLEEFDYETATHYSNTKEDYLHILKNFVFFLPDKMEDISRQVKQVENEKERSLLIINIHSLKSSLRMIGCNGLSLMAAELESAGNAGNRKYIAEKVPILLDELDRLMKNINHILLKDEVRKMVWDKPETDSEDQKSESKETKDAIPEHPKSQGQSKKEESSEPQGQPDDRNRLEQQERMLRLKEALEDYQTDEADRLAEEMIGVKYSEEVGIVIVSIYKDVLNLEYNEAIRKISELYADI